MLLNPMRQSRHISGHHAHLAPGLPVPPGTTLFKVPLPGGRVKSEAW
jgi:hypothetical protein